VSRFVDVKREGGKIVSLTLRLVQDYGPEGYDINGVMFEPNLWMTGEWDTTDAKVRNWLEVYPMRDTTIEVRRGGFESEPEKKTNVLVIKANNGYYSENYRFDPLDEKDSAFFKNIGQSKIESIQIAVIELGLRKDSTNHWVEAEYFIKRLGEDFFRTTEYPVFCAGSGRPGIRNTTFRQTAAYTDLDQIVFKPEYPFWTVQDGIVMIVDLAGSGPTIRGGVFYYGSGDKRDFPILGSSKDTISNELHYQMKNDRLFVYSREIESLAGKRLNIGFAGEEYWKVEPTEDTTSVRDPAQATDLRVYPNPFSETTSINYELQTPGRIKIDIFNSLGSKITTLVDEWQDAGRHNCELRINNYELSTGMYYYRIQIGDSIESGKLLLIK